MSPRRHGHPAGGTAGPARRRRAALSVREVIAAAARAGRGDPWRILAVAVTVCVVTALTEILIHHYVDPADAALSVTAELTATTVSLLGTIFLSGFLCRLVDAAERGGERVTIGQVVRTLPWGRLVLADLLLVVLVIVGLLALVIPGLVIFTMLALVGPVIEIEDRRVRAALRRSARLVRPHFWTVALLATLPTIAASQIETVNPEPSGAAQILETLAIRGIGEGLVEAAIGLVLVALCYRLIDLDARRPVQDNRRTGSGARGQPR